MLLDRGLEGFFAHWDTARSGVHPPEDPAGEETTSLVVCDSIYMVLSPSLIHRKGLGSPSFQYLSWLGDDGFLAVRRF